MPLGLRMTWGRFRVLGQFRAIAVWRVWGMGMWPVLGVARVPVILS